MNRQIYKMTIADASDSITFYLLDVPIVEEDVGGTATNTTIDGNVYTDYMWLKKQWKQKWSIMCKDEYTKLHDIFERQFTNAEVPNLKIFYGDNIHTDGNAEGQSFQITNDSERYDGEILDFSLYGNATQKTLSGKNLLPIIDSTASNYGITAKIENGILTINGTTTSACIIKLTNGADIATGSSPSASWLAETMPISDLNGKTISLDYESGTPPSASTAFRIYSTTTTHLRQWYPASTDQTYTWGESTDAPSCFCLFANSGLTFSNYKIALQIEAGSETDFEPYCGGIPAPNPDFPMPVENVSGRQEVQITGKNLFDTANLGSGNIQSINYNATDNGLEISGTEGTYYPCWGIYGNGETFKLNWFATATQIDTSKGQFGGDAPYSYSVRIVSGSPASSSSMRMLIGYMDGTIGADYVPTGGYYKAIKAIKPVNFIAFGVAKNITYDQTIQIQLELGDQATNYEPYQSTSYELNLGKNLFDTDTAVTRFEAYNGNAINDWGTYSDGIVTIVKSNGAHGTCAFAGFKPKFAEGQTYTLSANVYLEGTNASTQIRFGTVSNSNSQITIASKDTWITYTRTFTATASDVADPRIDIQAWNTGNTLKIKEIQLEAGSQATSYSAYKTPIELAKIGTYQDYIWNDDGTWKIHKEIKKITLDGSRNWIVNNNVFYTEAITDYATSNNIPLSPNFGGYTNVVSAIQMRDNAPDNTIAFYTSHQYERTYLKANRFANDSELETWLTNNPTDLYYALLTPTDTEITDSDLVGQLDALLEGSLYKGLNNVFLIPSVAPDGTMTMEYRIIYEEETIVQDTTPVKLDLTDGGIINACLCRQNVQVIMRETKDSSES